MESMNVSEAKILDYAREGMVEIGYPSNTQITSYIGDNNYVMYEATYFDEIKKEKHLKPLKFKDISSLAVLAMELKGYDSVKLEVRVRNNKVCYKVLSNIVTYENNNGYSKKNK